MPRVGGGKRELLRLAAAVEAHSRHPIAKGVVAAVDGAGGTYLVRRDAARVVLRMARRIRQLGYEVQLTQVA